MDEKMLKSEYKKLDKSIAINTLLSFGRGCYYNPKTQKQSKNIEDLLSKKDIDDKNYTIFSKGSFSYNYAFAATTRLSTDGNILFVNIFTIYLKAIKENLPTWTHRMTFAISKNKEIFQTISIIREPETYSWFSYKATNCFMESKQYSYSEMSNKTSKLFKTRLFSFEPLSYFLKDKNITYPENIDSYKEFAKAFTKFFDGNTKTVASNRVVDIEKDYKSLMTFLNYKEPVRKLNKKLQKLNEISLPEIKGKYPDTFGYAQKVDEYALLRVLSKNATTKKYEDIIKIFIDKNGSSCLKRTNVGTWTSTPLKNITNWDFPIYNIEDSALDKTIFRYTENILKDVKETDYSKLLPLVISNPLIEQLYKSSFKNICINLLNSLESSWYSFERIVKCYFGKINTNEKNLNRKLGLNKYQMEQLSKAISEYDSATEYRKYYFDINYMPFIVKCMFADNLDTKYRYCNISEWNIDIIDISNIDNDTFDKAVDIAKKIMVNYDYRYTDFFKAAVAITSNINTRLNIFNCFASFSGSKDHYRQDYLDYLEMYSKLSGVDANITKDLKVSFTGKNVEEQIVSAHDLLVSVYNTISSEIEKKAFDKAVSKVKKYEFEDEEFISVSPKSPQDIAREGITLCHCVKSYIPKVSNGYTNIMFIRKVTDKNTPFFTVEISNTGNIEQIHGHCNSNVEVGSSLENFVKKWAKQKKLKLNHYNKVR